MDVLLDFLLMGDSSSPQPWKWPQVQTPRTGPYWSSLVPPNSIPDLTCYPLGAYGNPLASLAPLRIGN